jgi:DMSO/TMAO reductase YedYZ heme-binding membrane subunit
VKNTQFAKVVVHACSLVPLAMMILDNLTGRALPDVRAYMIHTTGVTAFSFLLLSLCVTPLRTVTGKNYWSLFRRMLGLYAFFYACLHFLCYVSFDRGWDLQKIVEEITNPKRPFVFFGMTALALMIPLALTSTAASIKRLGAKRWKWLHRLVYITATCAAVHFFLFPKIRVWDSVPGAFALAVTVLLGFRLVAALIRSTPSKPRSPDVNRSAAGTLKPSRNPS